MARRSVCEERCRGGVGRAVVERGCLGDRTESSLHRTDVVPAKRSAVLRMKTAGWCMECIVRTQVLRRGAGVITQGRIMDTRRFGILNCNFQKRSKSLIYWCPYYSKSSE
jgi:hypothetical protein